MSYFFLQLGCGQAIPGLLVSALAPSAKVTLTDCSSKGLRLLKERCLHNNPGQTEESWNKWDTFNGKLSIRRHVWETDLGQEDAENTRHWSNAEDGGAQEPVPHLEVGATFDLILASDVAYFRSEPF